MPSTRAFIESEILSEIIHLRKDYPYNSAFSVLEKLCDIFLLGDVDIYKLAATNPIFLSILKRPHRKLRIQNKLEQVIDNPRPDDIFILQSPTSAKYKNYREEHGILVTNSLEDLSYFENLTLKGFRPYSLLTNQQKQDLDEHMEEYENISSWDEVFSSVSLKPINAAVIIDNYLFHGHYFYRRYTSLYSILKSIVPKNLKVPFHLTIFIENNNGEITKEQMGKVVGEIHKLNLCKEIKVSIITHVLKNKTHDRIILTNFHYITSGKGFSVIDNKGVQDNAKGEIMSTFNNILFLPKSSMTVKLMHTQIIDWMKDIYLDDKGTSSDFAFEVGDDFNNRLLMDE